MIFLTISLLVLAPLTAMLAEPFYSAVLAWFGIDSAAWAEPAMTMLVGVWSQTWFLIVLAFLVGLLAGAWLHRLATLWDAAREAKKPNIARLVSRIQPHIENVEGRLRYALEVCDGKKDASTFVTKMELQTINISALLEEARHLEPTIARCAEEVQIAQDEINNILAHVRADEHRYEPAHAANLYRHRATKMLISLVKLRDALRV